jgi:excisionase family DNA binding protein
MTNPFQTIDDRLSNIENLLLTIKHTNPPQQQNEVDELLTIQEAAKFLNLSVPTIYGFTQRAEIPVCKRSKRLYFSKLELTDWIKQGRKKTISETAIEAASFMSKKRGAQ